VAPALALLVIAIAWMGYYNFRNFGSPFTLPYKVNRATYATAPYFIWQPRRPEPVYHHKEIQRFYQIAELPSAQHYQSLHNVVIGAFVAMPFMALRFFAGFALLPPLILCPRVLLDRRVRFLVMCLAILAAGLSIEVFVVPHYMAPFTCVFYALGLQATRHLWLWRPHGVRFGMAIVRLSVSVCLIMAVVRLFNTVLNFPVIQSQVGGWSGDWYGPDHFGTERANIQCQLERLPGKQLVIARYSSDHDPRHEWVYNAAEIDSSKVIWAREMDPASTYELFQYYKDRNVWLVQPDMKPALLAPYPDVDHVTATNR